MHSHLHLDLVVHTEIMQTALELQNTMHTRKHLLKHHLNSYI